MQVAKSKLSILVPSSFAQEVRDLKIKTYKIGQLARASAVFRVDEIVVYRDEELDESRLIELVLKYAETPQYLRKLLFPMKKELKYAGVLPPLRTPHHPTSSSGVGEIRPGVVTKVEPDGSAWVELGFERPAYLPEPKGAKEGERVNVRIFSLTPLVVERVQKDEIPKYWGYTVRIEGNLTSTLKKMRKEGMYIIGTSKYGDSVSMEKLVSLKDRGDLCIVFGSPRKGLLEMVERNMFDAVLNTIPNQGTETVRTEEAIFATLALINVMRE
jgi:hypothetical protein